MQSFNTDVWLEFFCIKWLFLIGIQISILLCYFLFFLLGGPHLPADSQIGKLLLSSHDATRSQPNYPRRVSLKFSPICPALFWHGRQAASTLYFRSRCIWWDLNGASIATCDFTSCWFSQQDHPVLPRAFLFLPSALSSVCHAKQESSTSSTKMSNEFYSHHW